MLRALLRIRNVLGSDLERAHVRLESLGIDSFKAILRLTPQFLSSASSDHCERQCEVRAGQSMVSGRPGAGLPT